MPFKLNLRKQIKIAPGVKVNLSHRGVSTRLGGKRAGVTVGKRGARMSGSLGPVRYEQKIGGGQPAERKKRRWWLLWLA